MAIKKSTNIESTASLGKAIADQNKLMAGQFKLAQTQSTLLLGILKAVGGSPGGGGGAGGKGEKDQSKAYADVQKNIDIIGQSGQETLGKLNSGLLEGAAAAGEKGLGGMLKMASKGLLGMASGIGIVSLLDDGLTLASQAATSLVSVLTSVAEGIVNVGVSIITAPFKLLNAMIGMVGSGSTELRQALEDVRKEFGNLHAGASKAILGMWKSMHGRLAETGLRTYRIFGNLAEKLKTLTEYATKLGSTFNNLAGGLVQNAEAFGAYVKGLGLTDDGMKGVAQRALSTGQSFTEVSRQITSFGYQMGKAFGINGKQVTRAIGDMMKDVKNFGSLSVKQLSSIAIYANKLGLEFKDLLGVTDKFDNFEDAANAVSQLNQAFGLNLDTMEMVKEQDPAARFDKLRKALYQTGKSVDNMSRQELKLLAAQTGLSEEAVKLGFANSNQALSYEDVQKQASLTEKKQLSQAEAMHELASSIERLVKSGSSGSGGFFDRFFQGFMAGIKRSWEFRAAMRAIGRALMITFQAGRQLGIMFVQIFPGIKDIFLGIRDFFNPPKWRAMMQKVVGIFTDFFRDITTNPRAGLERLMERLKKTFFDQFSAKSSAGRRIIDGFGKFYKALFRIGIEAIRYGLGGIAGLIKGIFEPGGGGEFGSMVSAIGDGLLEILKAAFQEVVRGARILADAMVDFYKTSWPIVLEALKKFFAGKSGPDGEFTKLFLSLFSTLKDMAGTIGEMLLDVFMALPWADIGWWLLKKTGEVLTWALIGGVGLVAASIVIAIPAAAAAIVLALGSALYYVSNKLIDLLGWLAEQGHKAFDAAITYIFGAEALKSLYKFRDAIVTTVSNALTKAWAVMKAVAGVLYDTFGPLIRFWYGLQMIVPRVIGAIAKVIFGFVSDTVLPAMSKAGTAISEIFTIMKEQIYGRIIKLMVYVSKLSSWLNNNLVTPVVGFFRKIGKAWDDNVRSPIIQMMTDVSVKVKKAFDGLITSITNSPAWAAIKGALGPIIDAFNAISDAGQAASVESAANMTKANKAASKSAAETARSVVSSAQQGIAAVSALHKSGTAGEGGFQSMMDKMGSGKEVPGVEGQIFGVGDEATKRREALEAVNSIRVPSVARVNKLGRDVKAVTDAYTSGIVDNVRDLVAAVNTVTSKLDEISAADPQRINVKLKELADGLGVGGRTRLEIKNRSFTIALNVNVTLEADDLEYALIHRPHGTWLHNSYPNRTRGGD